jgi:hypothetical protein
MSTKKTLPEPKKYTPHALALAERVADKVLDPNHLFTLLVDGDAAGNEWLAIAKELRRTKLAHVVEDADRREASYEEAAFLAGLAIGRRLAVQQ